MTHNSSNLEDDDRNVNDNNNKQETGDEILVVVNISTTTNASSFSEPPSGVLPHQHHTEKEIDLLYALSPPNSQIDDSTTLNLIPSISNQQRSVGGGGGGGTHSQSQSPLIVQSGSTAPPSIASASINTMTTSIFGFLWVASTNGTGCFLFKFHSMGDSNGCDVGDSGDGR